MLLVLGEFKKVHIVIPSAALIARDRADYGDYWFLSGYKSKIEYHDTLKFKHGATDVLLMDEVDQLVF